MEMTDKIEEWVGLASNGEILCDGNPNPGHIPYHLSSFSSLLSFGRLLLVKNKRSCEYYCRIWNEELRKRAPDLRSLRVRPAKVVFSVTVCPPKKRKGGQDGRKAAQP